MFVFQFHSLVSGETKNSVNYKVLGKAAIEDIEMEQKI